jgi:hypothetical protein
MPIAVRQEPGRAAWATHLVCTVQCIVGRDNPTLPGLSEKWTEGGSADFAHKVRALREIACVRILPHLPPPPPPGSDESSGAGGKELEIFFFVRKSAKETKHILKKILRTSLIKTITVDKRRLLIISFQNKGIA